MPKQTFFKLTVEKQEQIINAAINEFSQFTFNEVKISNVISKAKIPRSSFYDYFEDKKDLYKYIIFIIKEDKMKFMSSIFMENQTDFFTKFKELFKAGAKFAVMKPEYEKLMNKIYDDIKLVEEILGVKEIDVSGAYKSMLIDGIRNGEIREDIDTEFVSKSIYILSSNLIAQHAQSKKSISSEFIEEIADKILDFIKFGILK